jgi:hypothetical protein
MQFSCQTGQDFAAARQAPPGLSVALLHRQNRPDLHKEIDLSFLVF